MKKTGILKIVMSLTLAFVFILPFLSASAGETTVRSSAGEGVIAQARSITTGAVKTAESGSAQLKESVQTAPLLYEETVFIDLVPVENTPPVPVTHAAENRTNSPAVDGTVPAAEKIAIENETLNYAITIIKNLIREYQNGMNDFRVYLVPLDENLQEFYADYYDNEGGYHNLAAGVFYSTETQLIYGKDQQGALKLGFDWDLNQMMFYAPHDSWHREFGFCEMYDIMAPAVGDFYKTFRVKFTYDNMDWMVQFWKGQYHAAFAGGEFGFYSKPADREAEFYDCMPDGWLTPMSMKIYQRDKLLFERPLQPHWWMTGFKPGVCIPRLLTMEGSMEFPAAGMKDAFLQAIETNPPAGLTYTVQDNHFSFVWKG